MSWDETATVFSGRWESTSMPCVVAGEPLLVAAWIGPNANPTWRVRWAPPSLLDSSIWVGWRESATPASSALPTWEREGSPNSAASATTPMNNRLLGGLVEVLGEWLDVGCRTLSVFERVRV